MPGRTNNYIHLFETWQLRDKNPFSQFVSIQHSVNVRRHFTTWRDIMFNKSCLMHVNTVNKWRLDARTWEFNVLLRQGEALNLEIRWKS